MIITLTFGNAIADCQIVRDDGCVTEIQISAAPNMNTTCQDVSRWAQLKGFEPVGGWLSSGVAEWSREFRRPEPLDINQRIAAVLAKADLWAKSQNPSQKYGQAFDLNVLRTEQ